MTIIFSHDMATTGGVMILCNIRWSYEPTTGTMFNTTLPRAAKCTKCHRSRVQFHTINLRLAACVVGGGERRGVCALRITAGVPKTGAEAIVPVFFAARHPITNQISHESCVSPSHMGTLDDSYLLAGLNYRLAQQMQLRDS